MQPASYTRRGVSFLVDHLVVAVPVLTVAVVLGFDLLGENAEASILRLDVATAAWSLVYFTVLVGRWGATLGKLVTRTRVVDVDGERLSWPAALQRALVPVALGVIPVIGPLLYLGVYAFAFTNPQRQGLHDRAAGSLVVPTRVSQEAYADASWAE
jgi:uncharacterized RDD family membrane protein YckC